MREYLESLEAEVFGQNLIKLRRDIGRDRGFTLVDLADLASIDPLAIAR